MTTATDRPRGGCRPDSTAAAMGTGSARGDGSAASGAPNPVGPLAQAAGPDPLSGAGGSPLDN